MRRSVIAGVVVVAIIAALAGDPVEREPSPRPAPTSTPRPPEVSNPVVNRQDRVSTAHRQREAIAFDERRLLGALPLVRRGVRFDLVGLDRDGRTAVLSVAAGASGRAHAMSVYAALVEEYWDLASHYRIRWER